MQRSSVGSGPQETTAHAIGMSRLLFFVFCFVGIAKTVWLDVVDREIMSHCFPALA